MKTRHTRSTPPSGSGRGTLVALAWCLLSLASASAWDPLPIEQDRNVFMPGSQPGDAVLDPPSNCGVCHSDFDPQIAPMEMWRGSMMAQAMRDPLFLACMTVAAQDSIWALGNPNAGDLCLRCHTPAGWLGGRSDPPNGSELEGSDFDGVACNLCHQMLDPFPALNQPSVPAESEASVVEMAADVAARDVELLKQFLLFDGSPFFDPSSNLPVHYQESGLPHYVEATSGQYFVDPGTAKRGPRHDGQPFHDWLYSRFHKSREFCGTCHDVSNPALANVALDEGLPERQAAGTYFHVERTWSEFRLSGYGRDAGAPPNSAMAAELGIDLVAACQDCHMPTASGVSSRLGAMTRPDIRLHDFAGGSTWMLKILASADPDGPIPDATNQEILSGIKYPAARFDVEGLRGWGEALLDGSERARRQLERAATLIPSEETQSRLMLRIQNNTGHKLISGFPEGRRMWLNVRFFDAQGNSIAEINPYDDLTTRTTTDGELEYVSGATLDVNRGALVYEAQLSSSLTGEEKTFHFVLATDRYKDNRIPPKGFDASNATARLVQPRWQGADAIDYFTEAEYQGGYDDVSIEKPSGTAAWVASLYYQTTSREYIEFLRDEINGSSSSLSSPSPSGEMQAYLAQTDPFFSELNDWGRALWQLWLHNGGAQPVLMTRTISPPLLSASLVEGDLRISFITVPGVRYQVQQASEAPMRWENTGQPVDGVGGAWELEIGLDGEWPQRFYRVVVRQ